MGYVSVEIDLDDFYDELSKGDKHVLIELLKEDDLDFLSILSATNQNEMQWNDLLVKLSKNFYSLSKEEEELITKIANRFI